MRVLWVCNIVPLPKIADELRIPRPVVGGWMTALAEGLLERPGLELSVCFPVVGLNAVARGRVEQVNFFGFPVRRRFPLLQVGDEEDASGTLRESLAEIIGAATPDLLHIFGTEFGHALAAAEVYGRPQRTLVSIQGLTSVYARHFLGTLPSRAAHRWAMSNLVRGSLASQAARLARRGEIEVKTLQATGHVAGRTDWDLACTRQINPGAYYHHCGEALRAAFYEGDWDRREVEANSIFMTQGSNPVKGLYYVLAALPEVLRRAPQAHLYVAGNDPTRVKSAYDWLKRSAYGSYLAELIREGALDSKVTFLGPLTEVEMRDRLLRSHVFVSASTIENSSNGLCEAQLVGVPCVASFVGGIPSLIDHGVDGFAYQHDAPYMLAHYVAELLECDDLAKRISAAAREKARYRHDRSTIVEDQAAIYKSMLQGE